MPEFLYDYDRLRATRPWRSWLKRLFIELRVWRFLRRLRSQQLRRATLAPRQAPILGIDKAPVKLNIGCGEQDYPGYVNLDVVVAPHLHVIGDIRQLPFGDACADEILCSDVLEHLLAGDGVKSVAEIFRVLREGGHLILVTPDLDEVCRMHLRRQASIAEVMQHLFGDSHDHKHLYTRTSLRELMGAVGFTVEKVISNYGPIGAHVAILAAKTTLSSVRL